MNALPPSALRRVSVRLLKGDYSAPLGAVPGYLSVSMTWQYLGVGTATLVVPESPLSAPLLSAPDVVVPVVLEAPGYPRWSGRVQHDEDVKPSAQAGVITATVVDEHRWFDRILAAPVPGQPWSNQTAAEYDTRTGPLETVAKAYVSANVNRLAAEGRPTPLVVVPSRGAGPTVTLQARNSTLQELLEPPLRTAGMDLTATLWLPGDEQPEGLALTAPSIVVDVTAGRDRPYVNFTDRTGGLVTRTVTGTHPGALGVLVQGPGEGTARTFAKVMATDGRVAALGMWGWPEDTVDATDAGADLTARGLEKTLESAGTRSVVPTLDDRRPWTAGPSGDYWVGDVVRATFSGVAVSDRIDRFTVTHSKDGFVGTPQFGSGRENETTDRRLAAAVAQLRSQVARLQGR